jgi:hypothetical protein
MYTLNFSTTYHQELNDVWECKTMAKIIAKSGAEGHRSVRIEGRTDECAVLAVDVILRLGAQIRATLADLGVTDLEEDGEAQNDFALAMSHMARAVQQREQERGAANDG